MRLLAAVCAAALLLAAPACVGQPASGSATAAEKLPWPTRAATLVREVEVGPWALSWVSPFGLEGSEPDMQDATLLAGWLGVDADAIEFEGAGSVVVRMPRGEVSRTARLAGKPLHAFEILTADERDDDRYQLQRTWFALYGPRDGEAVPRGVVVLLPGMFGTPEPVIDTLVGKLRERGWHVLRMLTHSSRFTERREYTIDPGQGIGRIAGEIGGEFSDRAAECAFATEAVCDYISETMPEIPIGSRLGLGMSGGGMVLPTVMAREHDAYSKAVYIGAGCDFASIAIESNYADWIDAVRIGWATEPSDQDRTVFALAYRDAAPLDSYATAPLVADIPTLMLHGEMDQAVPASLGDLLWSRLGEPERWTGQLTHETLFLAYLPSRFSDLLDWLDKPAAGDEPGDGDSDD